MEPGISKFNLAENLVPGKGSFWFCTFTESRGRGGGRKRERSAYSCVSPYEKALPWQSHLTLIICQSSTSRRHHIITCIFNMWILGSYQHSDHNSFMLAFKQIYLFIYVFIWNAEGQRERERESRGGRKEGRKQGERGRKRGREWTQSGAKNSMWVSHVYDRNLPGSWVKGKVDSIIGMWVSQVVTQFVVPQYCLKGIWYSSRVILWNLSNKWWLIIRNQYILFLCLILKTILLPYLPFPIFQIIC